jgi:hypothetical protein
MTPGLASQSALRRQRSQYDGANQTEDGRRDTDAEREKQHRHHGETRAPAERAARIAEILNEAFDKHAEP